MDEEALHALRQRPMEDTIWTVNVQENFLTEDSDEEETEMRLISIVDTRGTTVGLCCRPPEYPLSKHIFGTIRDTVHKPMVWKPRRPRSLFLPDHCLPHFPPDFTALSGVGVVALGGGASDPSLVPPLRSCAVCRRRGAGELFSTCPDCQTVFFCTNACRHRDGDDTGGGIAHKVLCTKMKTYSSLINTLKKLPFTFIDETSQSDFDDRAKRGFLERLGLCDRGLWAHEHHQGLTRFQDTTRNYGVLSQENPNVSAESSALVHSIPCPDNTLADWGAYYAWRGFPLDSPLAALMTYVMTVYYVVTTCVPRDYPEVGRAWSASGHVTIHLLGVEKEADLTNLFAELGILLPQYQFHILMVGPHISRKMHNAEMTHGNVCLRLHRGVYHSYEGPVPDVAIGLNAGLGAYRSWAATLRKLHHDAIPAYFTDYCRYSSDLSREAMQGLSLGDITEPCINPFRSPLRRYCEEHLMPWFSNAYLFHLLYSVTRRRRSLSQGATPDLET